MKILILGAGGIGGYFGAQLLRSGADVTFLLREKRQALIAQQGLRIESPHGDFTVQPPTVTASSVTPIYDLIILAPKSYDLDDALASLDNAIGQAVILPFLNGLDHLSVLDDKFGRAAVMGGVAHIAATITNAGAVRQLNEIHSLILGPRDPAQVGLARQFIALCEKTAFDSVYAEDIEQALWDKWVFLAALAGMTTLCRGSVGDILATPYGEGLMRQMYDECGAVARLSGYPTGEAATAWTLGKLMAPGSPLTASMLRDLLAGQRTEHQHIFAALVARGIALGLPMDLMRLAHTHLAVQAAHAAAT